MFSEDNKPDLKSNLVYSIEHHHHQKRILAFLQDNLSRVARRLAGATFNLAASKEDDVTGEIVLLLNDGLRITGGYLFGFEAKIGPDILIYALPYELLAPALFVIEAKRLPPTRSRDYVHSGIGRFKKEEHGERHEVAAMLAYVQDKDFTHWHKTINSWIDDLIHKADEFPAWTAQDKLSRVKEGYLGEYNSIHSRVSKDPIALHHFWIKLN